MADQATPPGASGAANAANAANEAAMNATANMERAQKMADALFEKSTKAAGAQSDAYLKMSVVMDKIAKQQAELIKINAELQSIEAKRVKLQKEIQEAGGKANEEQKKELQALREQIVLKRSAALEAKKAAAEQSRAIENMTKQESMLGKMFKEGKASMLGYVAGIASLSAALANMSKVSQDVIDVSALSGNYGALKGGFTGLMGAAYQFQDGMAEARTGLRFLGYAADEVNAAFKDLSVTGARLGGKLDVEGVARATTVMGRLSKMLGVTMPESTQHAINMQQRFGSTTATTAKAMLEIYDATNKYNTEAGQTVLVGRDITKVMFDLARESKAAAVDQKFLGQTITTNVLQLQAQGRNYQEALAQASIYVKKLSTEAPDWTQILAGRELSAQLKLVSGKLPEDMKDQLEKARPGLSGRITDILKRPVDEFTKQKLLQEALSGTSVGFEAMEKGVDKLITNLGDKANIALQQIYGINATEADSLIEQVNLNKKLKEEKEKLYAMDEEARVAQIQALYKVSKAEAEHLAQQKNSAELTDLIKVSQQEQAVQAKRQTDERMKSEREAKIKDLEGKRDLELRRGNQDRADIYSAQIKELNPEAGLADVEKRTGEELAPIQGDKNDPRAVLSEFWEKYLKNPLWQSAAGITLLAGKHLLELPGILRRLPGDMKGALKVFSGGGGGGGIPPGASKLLTTAAEATPAAEKVAEGAAKSGLLGKMGARLGGVVSGITGATGLARLGSAGGNLAGKLAKAAKVARGIPFLGSLAAAGFSVWQIKKMYDKWAAGEGIGTGDLAELGLSVASLVPGLGTVAVAADIGLSATSAYEGANKAVTFGGARMKDVPVAALPESATGTGRGGQNQALPSGFAQANQGANQAGANQIEFQSRPIAGPQGVDVEFIGRIPFAQILSMNMDIMKRGVGSPTGG